MKAASPRSAPKSGTRVLLVEDDADSAEALVLLLEGWGYAVDVAHNAPRALEAARANPPAVALIDIGLPGVSGYELAQKLRASLSDRWLFLVALTGHTRPEDRERALELGFDEHVGKPVDSARLAAVLAAGAQASGSSAGNAVSPSVETLTRAGSEGSPSRRQRLEPAD